MSYATYFVCAVMFPVWLKVLSSTELGNTLLKVAGVVLPLLKSVLILYSRWSLLYSILYSETHYSTQKY